MNFSQSYTLHIYIYLMIHITQCPINNTYKCQPKKYWTSHRSSECNGIFLVFVPDMNRCIHSLYDPVNATVYSWFLCQTWTVVSTPYMIQWMQRYIPGFCARHERLYPLLIWWQARFFAADLAYFWDSV